MAPPTKIGVAENVIERQNFVMAKKNCFKLTHPKVGGYSHGCHNVTEKMFYIFKTTKSHSVSYVMTVT